MQLSKGRVILLVALVASIIVNLILGFTVKHYYIATKLGGVEPTFAQHYWRQNLTVKTTKGHQLIVMFGDSRIAYWSPDLCVKGYDVVNRGITGETTTQMLYRFQSDVLALHPSALVIQAGINDLVAAGLAPSEEALIYQNTVFNLATMVDQAKSSGIHVILLTITPPASPGIIRRFVWSDRIATLVAEANRKLLLLHAPPMVHVIDTQQVLQTAPGVWKTNVILDTLHFTPAGYAELNYAVASVIENR